MVINQELIKRIGEVYGIQKGRIDSEGEWLAELGSRVPENGIIVEIGSYKGQSGAYLASSTKEGVITYLIDLWDVSKKDFVSPENHYAMSSVKYMDFAIEKLIELDLYKKMVLKRGLSIEHSASWKKPIDLLFIDGDHSYEGVKSDYEAWSPFVKVGGVIAFHDYMKRWPGVVRLVDEIAGKQLKFMRLQDRIWTGEK